MKFRFFYFQRRIILWFFYIYLLIPHITYMKKILFFLTFTPVFCGFGQVGIGTTHPNENAALEILSSSQGLLLPRLALSGTASPSPLSTHVSGMLIYNTATAGTGQTEVIPGLYVNDGSKWIRLADQLLLMNMDNTKDEWVNTTGAVVLGKLSDGITNRPPGTEFVASDSGNVGIGLSTPTETLQVKGTFNSIFKFLAPDNNTYHTGFYSGLNAFGSGNAGTIMATLKGDEILDLLTDSFTAINVTNEINLVSFTDGVIGTSGAATTMAIRENSTDIDVQNRTDGFKANLSLDAFPHGKAYLSANDITSNINSRLSLETNNGGIANISASNDGTGVYSRLNMETGAAESVNLSASNNRDIHTGVDFNTRNDGYLNLYTHNNTSQQSARITLDNSNRGQIELYSGNPATNDYGSINWDSTAPIEFSFNTGGTGGTYRFPRTDGSAGDVLVNDGSGNLNWESTTAREPWRNPDSTPASNVSGDIVYMNGNIGVGTTTPTEKLEVAGGLNTVTQMAPGSYGGFYSGSNALGIGYPATAMFSHPNSSFNPATDHYTYVAINNDFARMGRNDNITGSGKVSLFEASQDEVKILGLDNATGILTGIGFNNNSGLVELGSEMNATNDRTKIEFKANSAIEFSFSSNGTGTSYRFPRTGGAAGDILVNDGSGNLSWAPVPASLDTTIDAWIDQAAQNRVVLGTQSDGATTRPDGTQFYVQDDGHVSIGSSTAFDKLTINIGSEAGKGITLRGGNHIHRAITFDELANNGGGELNWRKSGGGAIAASIRSLDLGSYSKKGLGFFTGDFSDATTDALERMRIDLKGNVGVGTTSPKEKVEIDGAIKIGDGGYTGIVDNATTPVPTGGAGTLVFLNGHFFGWTGSAWKQLDN